MPLPAYFMVGECDGGLYDTRAPGWNKKPLRQNYSRSHRRIKTVADFKATLRAGRYAWPGGYPLYFVAGDGEALSFKTARDNFRGIVYAIQNNNIRPHDGWNVVGCEINYEDTDLFDAHTGEKIESAYGDDAES